MAFATLDPVLRTDDMERSVRFYVEVLGFACEVETPGYSSLCRDSVRIMLGAPNAHEEWHGPRFTGQLYIALESPAEVDALWQQVRDKATVVYPVDDFDYGMHEFGIRDDNGYHLAFGAANHGA